MKPWADEIRCHIETWASRLGPLHWWPRYVYHFTDVHNAVSILKTGRLYSRAQAEQQGLMQVDNASPQIIQQTRSEHRKYARLYFRPLTPTQYRNEGIRPINQRELDGAHCPMPIYFCFDALAVLTIDDTEFSDGNMGSPRVSHSSEQDFFFSIPFETVFHNRWFPPDERDVVVFHRNAEVLIPDRLSLEPSLRLIVCRSVAERQTLLRFLPSDLRRQWLPRIRLGDQGLFYRRWTFVEEVVVIDDQVVFRFNPNTQTPGPFEARFSYKDEARSDQVRSWQGKLLDAKFQLSFRVSETRWGIATLHLDDAVAFSGPLVFEDIPF